MRLCRHAVLAALLWAASASAADTVVFSIGTVDNQATEFGLTQQTWTGWKATYAERDAVYVVGKSKPADWPYIQPNTHDVWAHSRPHTFTILFNLDAVPANPLYLHIGALAALQNPLKTIALNDAKLDSQRLGEWGNHQIAFDPDTPGDTNDLMTLLPVANLRAGQNKLAITLDDGSWILYDYVQVTTGPDKPKSLVPVNNLQDDFLAGPLAGVEEVVFAAHPVLGEHWYANFAYYAPSDRQKAYREGAKLYRYNLRTKALTTILADAKGGIRDPQVDYDGQTILFSYRPATSEHYHLYTIAPDGTGLRQLTDGDYDDLEPAWLPDGGIVFVSSRAKRWVNCWLTQVANLYRCQRDGSGLRPLSSNNEHDNTPWPLADGRILYTRWEYVDRSQVHYHHLWVANPDGTGQMTWFGNLHPGNVYIDAKPVPGSDKVLVVASPGHGQTEHAGALCLIDPKYGPDDLKAIKWIHRRNDWRDPWAFSDTAYMAANGSGLYLLDAKGRSQEILRLPEEDLKAGRWLHEPRPLVARPRERVMPDRTDLHEPTGKLMLTDLYTGRNMAGVKPGEVKKLLVLESLPKPINFTGGMEPLTYGGSFTLERVLGTVPVEEDGSAYFEAPAMRSLIFVALDEQNLAVKRMQSFATVQPGEVVGCVGCHEKRVTAPPQKVKWGGEPLAMRRAANRIAPIADAPQVFDFPRDVQPILDRHCVRCHNPDQRDGRVNLCGDRGPMFSLSYFALTARSQVSDGRNRPVSNYAPRKLGSSNSPLLAKLDPAHHGVNVSAAERQTVRLWIDVGAPYPGTYAALGCGMVGGYAANSLDRGDTNWPETKAGQDVLNRRCNTCHTGARHLPQSASDEITAPPWEDLRPQDPRRTYARHLLYDLTRPAKSALLLAPLSKAAGGYGACGEKPVFADTADPDYAKLLGLIEAAGRKLDEIKRFDMPGFRPREAWVREMKRYGVLPASLGANVALDPYAVERQYWQSLWWREEGG